VIQIYAFHASPFYQYGMITPFLKDTKNIFIEELNIIERGI
jgi:hypothetical protein